MTAVYPVLATVAAYLLGSLSFAVIVTRVMGLSDPRTYGSKNPGATNVLRSGSKAAAIVTLLLDAMKGWLPVALVMWFGHPYGLEDGTVALVGLAAFLGHLWPVFFRFQGGKGVATALGVLLGLSWPVALVCAAVWLVMAFGFKVSSLAALVATVISVPGAVMPFSWWPAASALIWVLRPAVVTPSRLRAPARLSPALMRSSRMNGRGSVCSI